VRERTEEKRREGERRVFGGVREGRRREVV